MDVNWEFHTPSRPHLLPNMSEIGTPTALAAFPSASSSSSKAHIKLGRVHGSEETQAVAAVQGGAVWIYDVSATSCASLRLELIRAW
jgi:hypothetical protein